MNDWPKWYYEVWVIDHDRSKPKEFKYKRGSLKVVFEDARSMEWGELPLPKNWELV